MRKCKTVFLIAGCCVGLFACSPVATNDSSMATAASDTARDLALNANSLSEQAHSSLRSIALMDASTDTMGIEVVSGSQFDRLVVDAGNIGSDFKVLRLNNPERIAIDLPTEAVKFSRTLDASDSNTISQIRLGSHPGASRLVLDLKSELTAEQVEHDVRSENGKLIVSVARSGSLQTALVAPTSLETEPMAEMKHTYAEETETQAIEPKIEAPVAEQANLTAETSAAEELANNAESKPMLKSMNLEPAVGAAGNMLVADLQKPARFNLKRTAPSEYVLTLEHSSLDPNATMTLLAPASGNGSNLIRSVRPVVQGDDVLLRIFTTPEASLKASSTGNKIFVASAGAASDIRGQAKPEAAKEAAANAGEDATAKVDEKVAANAEPVNASGRDDISSLLEETPRYKGRLISLDLQDTDIDNALRIIAEVSNLNIIASEDVSGKVTLRLIDVPWDQALDVILKTNGLDKVQEGNVVRIAPIEKLAAERTALQQAQEAAEELEPLEVKYIRISYAKASELKALVESIITERGTVAYDERSNQLIIKDISKGIRNVAQLVSKLDLRTPQVLLETQIVEAQRSLARQLGSELGFEYVRSPATGNATGYNFPNSVSVGGSVTPGNNVGSSFPAAIAATGGSAIDFLFDSADGTKSLDIRLSALENEGRIRIISRPSVATTNNRQAIIKSVEKIRVKTPSGGLSVATGQGAQASGSSAIATEVIEVGITLEVTPQASPDYFVLLDIDAKSSTFGSREVEGIPSEVERSANSTVLVSSGQTFAMGGIYKISDDDRISGVPFFKDIPFFGHLFRRAGVDNSDEELLFFITPRIIEGSFDDAAMKAAA